MKIQLTNKAVRTIAALQKEKLLNTSAYTISRIVDISNINQYPDDEKESFDISEHKLSELKELKKLLEQVKVPAKTINVVDNWMCVIENPDKTIISSLQMFEKALKKFVQQQPNKWMMKLIDGILQPVCCGEIKYHPQTRDDYACVSIKYYYGYLFSTSEGKSHEIKESYYTFYKSTIGEMEQENIFQKNITDDDENDDDENDGESKQKRKRTKLSGKTLSQILTDNNFYPCTQSAIDEFGEKQKVLNSLYNEFGKQYDAEGTALLLQKNEYSFSSNIGKNVIMGEDGVKNKVVINQNKMPTDAKREKDNGLLIPYHLYIKCYDITKHREVAIHVDRLTKHLYNKNISSEIVINDSKRKLLDALVGNEMIYNDIIEGKSGGIIILCSGQAGTGKTLTAEVYAEIMQKPLYQVQSAQLGIELKSIEQTLHQVLRRAEMWDAVLLIDECDAYLRNRGEDVLQNAIVGIFLRLLEYYNGVLFLTTNRGDIIDKAILSRVTAHIKYAVPSDVEKEKIFNVLLPKYNFKCSPEEIKSIIKEYPLMVGRDIRNVCKLLRKYNPKEKNITLEHIKEFSEYLTFNQ